MLKSKELYPLVEPRKNTFFGGSTRRGILNIFPKIINVTHPSFLPVRVPVNAHNLPKLQALNQF